MGDEVAPPTAPGQAPPEGAVSDPVTQRDRSNSNPPCPKCGSNALPKIVFELTTGGIILMALMIIGLNVFGICWVVHICKNPRSGSCYEPRLKCSSCGGLRKPPKGEITYLDDTTKANPSSGGDARVV